MAGTDLEIPDREQLLMQVQAANRELRRMNTELEHRKNTLSTILAHLPDAVIALDRDLRFIYVDAVFARSYGCAPKDMIGWTWEELNLRADDTARFFQMAMEVLTTGERAGGEVRNTVTGNGGWSEYIIEGAAFRLTLYKYDCTGEDTPEMRSTVV